MPPVHHHLIKVIFERVLQNLPVTELRASLVRTEPYVDVCRSVVQEFHCTMTKLGA
jgi:hypothetical protein